MELEGDQYNVRFMRADLYTGLRCCYIRDCSAEKAEKSGGEKEEGTKPEEKAREKGKARDQPPRAHARPSSKLAPSQVRPLNKRGTEPVLS